MDVRHYRTDLFPEIEPYASGRLPLGGSHVMYWEQAGNPRGTPVLFLHGGPGAGAAAAHRRFFDPRSYRIIIFDQRGLRTFAAARRDRRQHHPQSRRRHRGPASALECAPMDPVRWLLGFDARLGVRHPVAGALRRLRVARYLSRHAPGSFVVSVWDGHLLSRGMAKLRRGVTRVRALGPPDQLPSSVSPTPIRRFTCRRPPPGAATRRFAPT